MYRKKLDFQSIVFKVFILYLAIYLLALLLRLNYDFESLIINNEYKFLVIFNIVSISFGLPLSIVFDLLLIKVFGIFYILLFAPILTFLGLIQVMVLRKTNHIFMNKKFLVKNFKNNKLFYLFENIKIKPIYIFLIRAFPILPFILGSYFIAESLNNKKAILINSLIGAYFYYFSLFLIIGKS